MPTIRDLGECMFPQITRPLVTITGKCSPCVQDKVKVEAGLEMAGGGVGGWTFGETAL